MTIMSFVPQFILLDISLNRLRQPIGLFLFAIEGNELYQIIDIRMIFEESRARLRRPIEGYRRAFFQLSVSRSITNLFP